MICSKCKTQIKTSVLENVLFCPHCGNKVDFNRCSEACNKESEFYIEENHEDPRILDDQDLYCKYCGAKSTYLIQGIHKED